MSTLTERTFLAFEAGSGVLLFAMAGAAFALLSVLGFLAVRNLPAGRAAVVISLRIVLAAVAVLLALRPVVRSERLSVRTTPVAVIVDSSASMGVQDQADGTSRLEAVAAWIAAHEELLDELEESAVVDWFTAADGTLRATTRKEIEEGSVIAAGGTDLEASLVALAERYLGDERPGLLLFSLAIL